MRALTAILILTSLVLATGAARAQAVIANPQDLPRLYAEAMAASDIETIVSFYAPNAILMTPEGPVAAGTDDIRALMTRNFAGGARLSMRFNQAQLDGGNGHAVMVWDWVLAVALEGQATQRRVRTMMYLKQGADGAWLIAADMYQLPPQ